MGTMENLFVQIFERKKWIVDQVKHQTLLFDQQLASKCLLNGIAPPPWLLSSPPTGNFSFSLSFRQSLQDFVAALEFRFID